MSEASFSELIARVRSGDAAAATELVHTYEPTIRRTVRVRLRDQSLQRLFDSMDVCQSVLRSFFVRAAAGQYDLEKPQQLLKLLVTMARNKLADEARRYRAECRDTRRVVQDGLSNLELADDRADPAEVLAARDLLQEFRTRLSDEERGLADRRARGEEWADIAADLGGNPDALRKRLTRAVDRVATELGLEG